MKDSGYPGLPEPSETDNPQYSSLKELVDQVTRRDLWHLGDFDDSGLADVLPFPFLALVGQKEMRLALLLNLVNPAVGGVLLIGPRGTGKTTAVRGLADLLPFIPRSLCYHGCMPEDIETGGIDAVCSECAQKYGRGEPLTRMDRARLIELPLNAKIDDVVGGVDERALLNNRLRLRKGILANADRNLLYVDEVNLLNDEIIDVILDAAAQGHYTVHRGPMVATYRSRFVLIGSMNPEEGKLRPQILDRFGLRIIVKGLTSIEDRLAVYRRVLAYTTNPRKVTIDYSASNSLVVGEVQQIRDHMSKVELSDEIARIGLELVTRLQIDSARAEISLFEASRAHAALDNRFQVQVNDILAVAPLTLPLRRSSFMTEYFAAQEKEDAEIKQLMKEVCSDFGYVTPQNQ
jgi:magnesium chelatase subunit I